MAAPTLVTVSKDITRRKKKLIVSCTLVGSYVVGGITIDWTTVKNPKFIGNGLVGSNPIIAEIINSPVGASAELIAGTTMKNWLLKMYTAPGTEMTAVAFSAGQLADPFLFELSGPLGNF